MSVALRVNRGNASGMLKHDGPAAERVELTLETVELLRIAATVATNVRRGSHRKVNIYKPATGETLRQAPLDEYYTGIAKTLDLTFSLRDDAPQTVCAGWEGPCPKKAKPGRTAFIPAHITRRHGEPWRCLSCGSRRSHAMLTVQQKEEIRRKRSESVRKSRAAMTPQQRSEAAAKRNATMTPQQRRDSAVRANAAMTSQQRSEVALKIWATRRAKAVK